MFSESAASWLLEKENPCIRFLTLTELLGRRPGSREAAEARWAIPDWRPVARILSNQNQSGGWERTSNWYIPKYKTTVWQLILLSQSGISPGTPSVEKMCDYAFRFQSSSGGFVSDNRFADSRDWAHDAGCLNGNVIAALCRLGHAKDKRIDDAVDHLISLQEADGGWGCRTVKSHRRAKHSCMMGAICALDAMLEYERHDGRIPSKDSINKACEFLLMHRLFRADHHGWDIIDENWTKLRAPSIVAYDMLRGLDALTKAGIVDDPRMEESISILSSKRMANGRWVRDVHWPSNTYSSFGRLGKEDKWVTLKALQVLRRLPPQV